MNLGLTGKVALVTGGSYGIGRAIAALLAAEGCHVAICARGQARLDAAAKDIPGCLAVAADATAPDAAGQVVSQVVARFGGLDILINNVGGGGGRETRAVDAVPPEVWQKAWDGNAGAAMRFSLQAIPHMRRKKWGRVVSIASTAGKEGNRRAWYTMAKSAQIALMKSLALNHELARDGMTFNTVAPGRVIFPGNEWDQFRQEDPQRFADTLRSRLPLGRAGTPEEIAAVVAFLCSPLASLVNGACLAVDGGESYSF